MSAGTGASPKAMDPERLADVKQFAAAAVVADSAPWVIEATALRTRALLALTPTELDGLLADRDHWEADARQWEEMCDVAAEKLIEARADRDRLDAEVRKTDALLIQALTKRDDARAEAQRYRDRCPVTAEDVTGDITAKARSWAFASGFERPYWWNSDMDARLGEENDDWFVAEKGSTDEGVMACTETPQQRVADLANWATAYVDACPLDILDEMAAQEAP